MHTIIATEPAVTEQQLRAAEPSTQEPQDSPIDIRIRLSALWVAMLFVFAYVDIFQLMRAEVLESLLEGEILNTPFEVTQGFLLAALVYILPASLMVYFSLSMKRKTNRVVTIGVAALYIITIFGGLVGEDSYSYIAGSVVEILILAKLIHLAWRWPARRTTR